MKKRNKSERKGKQFRRIRSKEWERERVKKKKKSQESGANLEEISVLMNVFDSFKTFVMKREAKIWLALIQWLFKCFFELLMVRKKRERERERERWEYKEWKKIIEIEGHLMKKKR